MLKLTCAICICLATVSGFCQVSPKYEAATITDVKIHPDSGSAVVSYDISVKVGEMIYVVLYTPLLGTTEVKYAAGRELLVLVGEKTIRYNDILGESHELPILSQRPTKQPN